MFLIPDVYQQLSSAAIGSIDLVHLIVSVIDATQLQELICEILQGHLVMFKKDTYATVISKCTNYFILSVSELR